MAHCQECQQPCLEPYVTQDGQFCRNCYEMLEARWVRHWDKWEPSGTYTTEWREAKVKKKPDFYRKAHPGMDYLPRHTKEELDG